MQVGEWRWIAGQGYMRIEELPDSPAEAAKKQAAWPRQRVSIAVTCRTPGGYTYWAGAEQVGRLATTKAVLHYEQELKRCNLPTKGLDQIHEWIQGVKK